MLSGLYKQSVRHILLPPVYPPSLVSNRHRISFYNLVLHLIILLNCLVLALQSFISTVNAAL